MSGPLTAGVVCFLIGCGPGIAAAGPPTRGCVMLTPSAVTPVSADQMAYSDLCVPDGQAVGYLSVWDTRAWTGKVVPPYNRVTMTARPGDAPATVTLRTASGLYRAEISALQGCSSLPPAICFCYPIRSLPYPGLHSPGIDGCTR
jgi:hypothetical protein